MLPCKLLQQKPQNTIEDQKYNAHAMLVQNKCFSILLRNTYIKGRLEAEFTPTLSAQQRRLEAEFTPILSAQQRRLFSTEQANVVSKE